MENTFLMKFKEKDYEEISSLFLEKTQASIEEHGKEMNGFWHRSIDRFLRELEKLQNDIPINCGQVHISFLRTSLYFEEPAFRIDAYDEKGVFGQVLLSQEIRDRYLFSFWNEYKSQLSDRVKELHYERYVSEEQIRIMMSEKINLILYWFYFYMKYSFRNYDTSDYFYAFRKSEQFMISTGEYMDWQKLVFIDVPEIDLFFNVDQKPCTYQKINEKVYKNKKFSKLDLTGSRFTNCRFVNCSFTNCTLIDNLFRNCSFKNVRFEHVTCYGIDILKCALEQIEIVNADCDFKYRFGQKLKDLYKPSRMWNCNLQDVSFEHCNLNNCIMEQCTANEVSTSECEKENCILGTGGSV